MAATLNANESSTDIGVSPPYLSISQGATLTMPLTARVVSNGTPQSGAQVNFTIVNGFGSLSAASTQTNSGGYATVTLSVTQISATVQVTACVTLSNSKCAVFYGIPVPLAQHNLQPVAGAAQVSTGQAFQPLVIRVTDSSSPPNPVMAAPVIFLTTVLRPGGTSSSGGTAKRIPGILRCR